MERSTGTVMVCAGVGVGKAGIGTALDRTAEAVTIYGAAHALLESNHIQLVFFDREQTERSLAALRAQLDPVSFDSAWEAGRALTLEQAIALALGAE